MSSTPRVTTVGGDRMKRGEGFLGVLLRISYPVLPQPASVGIPFSRAPPFDDGDAGLCLEELLLEIVEHGV
ncbi:hypothetical protein DE4585_03888 [Mycobacteroides salmoniphilum]|uniref:Uncharacterized protein n=1 Tax=Mycobacteroides salmoniphilum TaxID=404941 RepID=A0A4R8RZZ8_9MYCO|nr:hypothetical protein DE4585_03888 [Mycobacteroides salmoniphilum]